MYATPSHAQQDFFNTRDYVASLGYLGYLKDFINIIHSHVIAVLPIHLANHNVYKIQEHKNYGSAISDRKTRTNTYINIYIFVEIVPPSPTQF